MFTNLLIAKTSNRFDENTISLNELIGYVELTDSNEIWPEHSLSIEEQKGVGD